MISPIQTLPVDIALTYDEETNLYDINFNEEGDLESDNGFFTSLILSVFCERRADSSEVPSPQFRRGWFGNLFSDVPGFEMGSKLWIISQARNTQLTLNRAINYLQQALQWYVDDKHLQKVTVTGFQNDFGIVLNTSLLRYDNVIINISFYMWENTLIVLDL